LEDFKVINKVILMGRLTADPELRQTTSGISCCRFSVAVNRGYKSKETGETLTDFVRVIAWRQTAEFICKYFSKGKMIIVEGSLRNNDYTDANGVKHYSMEVQADNVTFGETKSASAASGVTNNRNSFQAQTQTIAPQNNARGAASVPQNDIASESSVVNFEGFQSLDPDFYSDGDTPF
jgi:single-strand DNA-binding protein